MCSRALVRNLRPRRLLNFVHERVDFAKNFLQRTTERLQAIFFVLEFGKLVVGVFEHGRGQLVDLPFRARISSKDFRFQVATSKVTATEMPPLKAMLAVSVKFSSRIVKLKARQNVARQATFTKLF